MSFNKANYLGRAILFSLMLFLFALNVQAEEKFQVKKVLESFETLGDWNIGGEYQGPKTAINIVNSPVVSGNGAAELVYNFIGSVNTLNYCIYYSENLRRTPLPGEPEKISFWVHGDASGHFLRIRLTDASGRTMQYNVTVLDFVGWREVSISVPNPNERWGGPPGNDIAYPISFDCIVIDTKDRAFVGEGKIFVDDLVLETRVSAAKSVELDVKGLQPGNAFSAGDPAAFNLLFRNLAKARRNLFVKYSVDTGKKNYQGSFTFVLFPEGSQERKITLPIKEKGDFVLKVSYYSGDRIINGETEVNFTID